MKKTFLNSIKCRFWKKYGKSKKMENIDFLNLSQQKEEGIILYQNQIVILQSFSQNIY